MPVATIHVVKEKTPLLSTDDVRSSSAVLSGRDRRRASCSRHRRRSESRHHRTVSKGTLTSKGLLGNGWREGSTHSTGCQKRMILNASRRDELLMCWHNCSSHGSHRPLAILPAFVSNVERFLRAENSQTSYTGLYAHSLLL